MNMGLFHNRASWIKHHCTRGFHLRKTAPKDGLARMRPCISAACRQPKRIRQLLRTLAIDLSFHFQEFAEDFQVRCRVQ